MVACLQNHDVVFRYKTGKNNAAADCLSRMGLGGEPDQVQLQE